jgi:regulator of replication initiation timing
MLRYAKDISDDRTKLKLENRELRRRLEELEG